DGGVAVGVDRTVAVVVRVAGLVAVVIVAVAAAVVAAVAAVEATEAGFDRVFAIVGVGSEGVDVQVEADVLDADLGGVDRAGVQGRDFVEEVVAGEGAGSKQAQRGHGEQNVLNHLSVSLVSGR